MKADLHCHSYYSDGRHSPAFLLERATENALTHLAVTDHDCIAACLELATLPTSITLINGVEISCDWAGQEIHIVGLCIDLQNADLQALLTRQQQRRLERMREMDARLEALGSPGLWPFLESLPCIAYTRSHAADFLMQVGLSKSRPKAFKGYLGKRGRIYAAPQWCAMEEAVSTIRGAGGIAVIAHPSRYPLSKRKLTSLIDEFKLAGGEALEVSYGNILPADALYLKRLANEHGLFCSVGSDFHDAEAKWTDLGRFPALDEETKKSAIWLHSRWHS